jgi:glycerate kinase
MKIVVAPNALKGSCTAAAAAAALARGVARALPDAEILQVPVADGGDGLADIARHALGADLRRFKVTGPRFEPVDAELAWLPENGTAIVEMALASGLALLAEHEQDPLETTTLGTGELMRHALDLGATRLVIGIGGSATNDGGVGMATALGVRFLDDSGRSVPPIGGCLQRIAAIDGSAADARLSAVRIEAICDVDNPLTGTAGAAAVYGPQKGADEAGVALLDAGLTHLAALIERDLGVQVRDMPGAGAAGGLGAGLVAFCGAALRPGAEVVLELVGLDAKLAGSDLVLTAEGRIDGQTRFGKAPGAVAAHARRLGIPCVGIGGSVAEDVGPLYDTGMDAVLSLCNGPLTLVEARARSEHLLAAAAEQVVRVFCAGAIGSRGR